MQLVRSMLVMWVWSAGVAHADEYPVSDVDRPLLLSPGMTAFDIAADVSTYIATSDPNTGQPTSYTHDTTSTLAIAHQFGRFEVNVDAYSRDLAATVLVRTTDGAAVFIGGDAFEDTTYVNANHVDTKAITSEYAQRAGYSYKLVAVPHRLAVYANVGLQAFMFDIVSNTISPTSARELFLFGNVSAELQVTRRLAFSLSPSLSAPLAYTKVLGDVPAASIAAGAIYAFRRVDIYVHRGRRPPADPAAVRLDRLRVSLGHALSPQFQWREREHHLRRLGVAGSAAEHDRSHARAISADTRCPHRYPAPNRGARTTRLCGSRADRAGRT